MTSAELVAALNRTWAEDHSNALVAQAADYIARIEAENAELRTENERLRAAAELLQRNWPTTASTVTP